MRKTLTKGQRQECEFVRLIRRQKTERSVPFLCFLQRDGASCLNRSAKHAGCLTAARQGWQRDGWSDSDSESLCVLDSFFSPFPSVWRVSNGSCRVGGEWWGWGWHTCGVTFGTMKWLMRWCKSSSSWSFQGLHHRVGSSIEHEWLDTLDYVPFFLSGRHCTRQTFQEITAICVFKLYIVCQLCGSELNIELKWSGVVLLKPWDCISECGFQGSLLRLESHVGI